MPKKAKVSKTYRVTLEVNGEVLTQEADTILEALNAFKPVLARTRAVFTAYKGERQAKLTYLPMKLRFFFAKLYWREIVAKRFSVNVG